MKRLTLPDLKCESKFIYLIFIFINIEYLMNRLTFILYFTSIFCKKYPLIDKILTRGGEILNKVKIFSASRVSIYSLSMSIPVRTRSNVFVEFEDSTSISTPGDDSDTLAPLDQRAWKRDCIASYWSWRSSRASALAGRGALPHSWVSGNQLRLNITKGWIFFS